VKKLLESLIDKLFFFILIAFLIVVSVALIVGSLVVFMVCLDAVIDMLLDDA
jgi:uncharacterized membrane protein YjjP (DUF1212 family)